ncbi:hypothetical protein B0H16DRAFT_1304901 [Mycena metata]|uniref:Uncharacterized protein n=1 Tax=Mycena metata TaxID=1033252 RepID=A0AAD7JW99_9AGAR|nr:hypothetical protein B0H16DRAFT_1304901 [Mycena metata]
MNCTDEPLHYALLTTQGTEPFNAEALAAALVEFKQTPEDLVYCRNHGHWAPSAGVLLSEVW